MKFIYPYKAGSASVKAIRAASDEVKIIKTENSKFKGNPNKVVVNWGSSKLPPEVMECTILNHPDSVALASNKKTFFDHVQGKVNIPEYTEDSEVARGWVNEGTTVVVRETLTGSGGVGVVVIETEAEWEAYNKAKGKIFVKYIPKKHEFRIHVSDGKVIDMQRKAARNDFPKQALNWKVRNHHNGFIFARQDVDPPQDVIDQAVAAVKECGLDFGAVDVIYNEFRKKAYVLEINTAPGLENTTLDTYMEEVFKVKYKPKKVMLETAEGPKATYILDEIDDDDPEWGEEQEEF